MRRQLALSLWILVFAAFVPSALEAQVSVKGSAVPAPSADAQLAQASRLWQQMDRAPLPQKLDLLAQTMANLALVRKQWPNDKRAVARSGIMQADLAAEFGALPKAIDGLLEALPAASKTDMEPGVELRLGKAYEQIGNAAEAEKHFLGAERTMHASHLNRVESEDILSSTGLFYSRQQKPSEAIRRFHEAQRLPGQDVVNRATLQLQVLREAVKINGETSIQEFASFDDLMAEAQRSTLGHGDAALIADVQKDAKSVREKSKP
jgi:tetratricopeptide (TPR) repeat protein